MESSFSKKNSSVLGVWNSIAKALDVWMMYEIAVKKILKLKRDNK